MSAWHSVVALGTDGGQQLADGDALAAGVHLLWAIRPELAFPVHGYRVSRRAHLEPEWLCLNAEAGLLPPSGAFGSWEWDGYRIEIDRGAAVLDPAACSPVGAAHLPGERSLLVRTQGPAGAAGASGIGRPPLIEILADNDGDVRVVGRRRAIERANGSWDAVVWADGAVGCRVSGNDLRICQVCFAEPVRAGGWESLHDGPILTPVVVAGTANAAAHLHDATQTRAEAYRRLSATLGDDARRDLASAFADDGPAALVEDLLRAGRGAMLPAEATHAITSRVPPMLTMPAAELLALAALDPDVSRMLGLYWHDPVGAGSWDYRVVAHHGDVPYPGRIVAFDGLIAPPGGSTTLALEGVTVVGSGGLEIVDASADSGDSPVLRVHSPRIGTAAGLRLDPPVQAVALRVAGDPGVEFAAWRGARRVASATASLGFALLEDADGIDAVTWSTGPVDLLELDLREEAGPVGDLTAYAWMQSPAAPEPVQDLLLTEAAAAVEPTRLRSDGGVDGPRGVVGLDWDGPSPVQDASRPVRAHVGRAATNDDTTIAPAPAIVVRNADLPAPAFSTSSAGAGRWPGPEVPQRWIERGLAPGSYAWSVRGIDVFGRLGAWSETRVVGVPAGTVPPPPDAVEAAYLDAADPYLSDEQRMLVERDGNGLLVQWTWPAERRIAAPGVEPNGEFRVYVRRGDPNLIEGEVRSIADLGDSSRLETDCTLPGPANGLAGERLRVGGSSFPVIANATGGDAAIEVAHLVAPTARPGDGPFTVQLSEASALRTDLASPRAFEGHVHAQRVGTLLRVSTRIAAVVASGASATVTLDEPLPATATEMIAGRLIAGGIAFAVVSQAAGSAQLEVGRAVQVDGSSVLPAAGERCTVWVGARYLAWLPGVGETPAVGERVALMLVGVSTCDVDAVVLGEAQRPVRQPEPDDRGSPGLEGPVSPVVRVSIPHRGAPPTVQIAAAPEQDGDIPADIAEPADWYGRARYELEFAPVAGAVGYRVLRASAAALFESDRGARQTGSAPYSGGPFDDLGASEAWLAEHHSSIAVSDMTADLATHPDAPRVLAAWREWTAWYYPQKPNREIMALAEFPCNEPAFRPAHGGTIAASPFADDLDGRGLGRFVYRVRSVDASGNSSPLSAAFPLVDVRDITPPATPSVTSVLGAESAVVLRWRSNREPDLAAYRIWRARRADELDDVRRLAWHARVAPAPGAVTEVWTDEGLRERVDWYYRIAAVDASGNVSPPTPALRARPVDTIPPNPPAWRHARWNSSRAVGRRRAVSLEWEGDEDALVCMLERRADRARVWTPITGWLESEDPRAAGQAARRFRYVDELADPAIRWRYRVRARDAAGNVATGLVEILVDVPGESA